MSTSLPCRVLLSSENSVNGGELSAATATVNLPGCARRRSFGSSATACGLTGAWIGAALASTLIPVPFTVTVSARAVMLSNSEALSRLRSSVFFIVSDSYYVCR
ncbi:Uncharacterised protein [Klebsiella pneumoniae]|nr:Uncharacterised protein [Klebsiella pneumoniae]